MNRVSVSLDSLDNEVFKSMNDVDFPVDRVIRGMDAAAKVGLTPDQGQHGGQARAERGQHPADGPLLPREGLHPALHRIYGCRHTNGWRMDDVVPAAEIIKRISAEMPLEPADPNYTGEVAERWRYKDGSGEIGVIASVTQAFCRTCNRARLSAEGKLYTCLFAVQGHDFREPAAQRRHR